MNKTLLPARVERSIPWWALPALGPGTAGTCVADEALERTLARRRRPATGGQPTSLPTQIPDHHRGHHPRGDRDLASTPPTARTRSSTCPACWCASATSATTTTPSCRPAPRAPATSARSAVYADGILLSNYLGNGIANGSNYAPRWGLVTPEEIYNTHVRSPSRPPTPRNSAGAVVDYVTRMPPRSSRPTPSRWATSRSLSTSYNTRSAPLNQLADQRSRSASPQRRLVVVHRPEPGRQPGPAADLSRPRPLAPGTARASRHRCGPLSCRASNTTNTPWYILGTATQYHTLPGPRQASSWPTTSRPP